MSNIQILPEILNRCSVRAYSNREVEWEKIVSCLEAARLAPSACNKQPWHFVVVDDPTIKDKLCKAAFDKPPIHNKFVYQAPVIIAVIARVDFMTHSVFGGIQGLQYYLLDNGAAVENLLLQAVRLGLGACWLGWFNEKAVKKALDIPRRSKVVSMISFGYPAETKDREKKRKPLEEIYSRNKFNFD